MMEDKITWRGPEYFHWEKGPEWYLAMAIVVLGVAAAAVILKNYIFAVLIVLAAVSLAIFSLRGPRIVDMEINNKGVVLDKHFYPYSTLESFWVDEDSHHPKILFKSKKLLMPFIHLPLPDYIESDVEIEELKNYIFQFLDEEELQEPFFQKILEMLGF